MAKCNLSNSAASCKAESLNLSQEDWQLNTNLFTPTIKNIYDSIILLRGNPHLKSKNTFFLSNWTMVDRTYLQFVVNSKNFPSQFFRVAQRDHTHPFRVILGDFINGSWRSIIHIDAIFSDDLINTIDHIISLRHLQYR